MAVRLPLVLSQPGRRDASAVELIETIVAAALLVPRLDANLVGDIAVIEPGSTDHLCLQGHTRDLILASFLDLDAAQQAWNRLGQPGRFIDCDGGSESGRGRPSDSQSQRCIFYFRLQPSTRVATLLDRCQQLVEAQAVPLVSLALGQTAAGGKGVPLGGVSAKRGSTLPGGGLPVIHVGGVTKDSTVSAAGPSAAARNPSIHAAQDHSLAARRAEPEPEEDWSNLDQLVDDLDALDL